LDLIQFCLPRSTNAAPSFGAVFICEEPTDELTQAIVEALAEDRAALWARVGAAGFLSDAEKRELVGV
jgi:hypothetical protein